MMRSGLAVHHRLWPPCRAGNSGVAKVCEFSRRDDRRGKENRISYDKYAKHNNHICSISTSTTRIPMDIRGMQSVNMNTNESRYIEVTAGSTLNMPVIT